MVYTLSYIAADDVIRDYTPFWIVYEAWRRGKAGPNEWGIPPTAMTVNEAIDWLVNHFPQRYQHAVELVETHA